MFTPVVCMCTAGTCSKWILARDYYWSRLVVEHQVWLQIDNPFPNKPKVSSVRELRTSCIYSSWMQTQGVVDIIMTFQFPEQSCAVGSVVIGVCDTWKWLGLGVGLEHLWFTTLICLPVLAHQLVIYPLAHSLNISTLRFTSVHPSHATSIWPRLERNTLSSTLSTVLYTSCRAPVTASLLCRHSTHCISVCAVARVWSQASV